MASAEANWLTLEGSSFSERSFSGAWLLALGTYGVGDIVTTIAIVYFVPMFTEANPAVRWAIESFGGGGFLALKLLVIYCCIGVSIWGGVLDEDPLLYYGPPALLTAMGLAVTWLNLGLLFS
ncbi:hypothetical protein [Haloarcula salina]|uniref:DUF5658 domain-containing protein n=1 Tax=Haloarcula salina TaxID=1429914 RepID=A0AA41FZZ2_9EURY|nr:hypothetical protein [Haloarcula salina]MBV0901877.1 hypothetical protein [Haloarcula salina]